MYNLILLFVDLNNYTIRPKKKDIIICNVPIENVIETVDVRTIYEAPISFYNQKLDKQVLKFLNLNQKKANLSPWKN